MKTYLKYRLNTGETKHSVNEKVAHMVWKEIRTREIDGKIGIDNTWGHDDIRTYITKFLEKNGWITTTDRVNNIDRYQTFIDRVCNHIMHSFLMKTSKDNPFFYPGLLNNPHMGYFIASSHEEVKYIKEIKQDLLDGMTFALKHRTIEADQHVKLLASGEIQKRIGKESVEVQ